MTSPFAVASMFPVEYVSFVITAAAIDAPSVQKRSNPTAPTEAMNALLNWLRWRRIFRISKNAV
jgi:hypothetical protein